MSEISGGMNKELKRVSVAVELLLQHGAMPDLPNVMGVTPLMAAAGIGYGQGSSRAGVQAGASMTTH